eukprot:TRINITY_DN3148_c0_g1_i4.p1 TRINITY_DN3148_c0_g1~~TRINITY_DN3148_c0_g1_i4.p1  ORF type:complete len:211 (+),score=56.96 TRINITY_DN3148_c0_g1_i4:264-896(+)
MSGEVLPSNDGAAGEEPDVARKAFRQRTTVLDFQDSFTAIEKCCKPVIAAVHGGCIGGGVDLITACDIRFCTTDAYFVVKEVDIALAADVGTLQRLPKIVGNDSLVRELCYTARKMPSDEALRFGLVSRVVDTRDACIAAAVETASLIASKSPIGIVGTKINLNFSRDHSTASSLDYVATWNMAMLQTEDLPKAAAASLARGEPAAFAKL